MSSVSWVASTAPWPGRAWSEWPWVITARSTGRTGSMWKPPGLQHSPAGNRASGCLAGASPLYSPARGSFESSGPTVFPPNPVAAFPRTCKRLPTMPARLFLSSGDLIADRRFDFARDLQLQGRSCRRRRPDAAGDRAGARLCLGLVHVGRNSPAARRARRGDRGVPQGAGSPIPTTGTARGLRLMRLGAEPVSAMPPAYVRALFDQYAPKFETALVDDLGYRGPALLFKAVLSVRAAHPQAGLFPARRSISAAAPGLRPRPSPTRSTNSSASTCRRA